MKKVLMDGKECYGIVGEPTKFKTSKGERLSVGDVVKLKSESSGYSSCEFVVKGKEEYFIMGIYGSCDGNTGKVDGWEVFLETSYKDVKDGENYSGIEIAEKLPEIGKKYRVIGNRKSTFGSCGDIQKLEGKIVKVKSPSETKGRFAILDEFGGGHVCEACNLEEIESQINNIVKGNDSMKREFKVGDRVKIRQWNDMEQEFGLDASGDITCDQWFLSEMKELCGKEFIISEINGGIVKGHKFGWGISTDMIELVKESLTISSEGTTTKVKFEDGREGVAKLYYKDIFNPYFGIIVALGKALGVDLIAEIQKVLDGYEKVTEKITATVTKFKVGDIVRGIDDYYNITNKDMTKGKVVRVVDDNTIDVEVLDHKDKVEIGHRYNVESKHFELVKDASKFIVGCKVKIPKTKSIYGSIESSIHIKRAEDIRQDYLYLVKIENGIYFLAVTNAPGQGDCFALEDLELCTENKNIKINISFDGRKTIAEDEDGNKGEAICNSNEMDTYSKVEGTRIAVARLLGENPFPKDKKVVSKKEFKIGDKVKLIVKAPNKPKFGWGYVKTGDIGIIAWISNEDDEIKVDFPSQRKWNGVISEFELAETSLHKKPILSEEKTLTITDFKIGDKVVPHAKNGWGYSEDLENEGNWKAAKRINQPYLYVIGIDENHGKDVLVLSSSKTETCGNYFLPTDVTFYDDTEEKIKIEEPLDFKKGDKIYRKLEGYNTFVGIFDHIYGNEVWANWSIDDIPVLPKSNKEFDGIKLNDYLTYVSTKGAVKKLELMSENKKNVKFKVMDHVRLVNSLGVEDTEKGDTAVIESVGEDDYKIRMDKDNNYWFADDDDLELVEELTFKVGDKVRLTRPIGGSFDMTKKGDIAVILNVYHDGCDIKADKDGHKWWAAKDALESIEDPEFNIGDYIYFIQYGKYDVCKINKIQDNKVYGFWTPLIKELPKTISEFETIKKESTESFMPISDLALKKLILKDDTVKIGDKVSREKAIEILEAGGEIKEDWHDGENPIYFIEGEDLYFKTSDGKIHKSSGYKNNQNLNDTLTIVSFKREIVNQELWEEFINNKTGIYCDTEDEAKKLLKYCEDKGIDWVSGSKATSHTHFDRKGTYYFHKENKGLTYDYANSRKIKIVTFKELFNN